MNENEDRSDIVTLTREAQKSVAADPIYEGTILLPGEKLTDLSAADRFRVLRTQLEKVLLNREDEGGIITITSAVPSEGKSLLSVNLSRALASGINKKVLLIDCDLRRPTMHNFFGLDQEYGVSDAIASGSSLSTVVRKVNAHLDVITAGSIAADPVGIIEHPSFEKSLEELKPHYSTIVLDCPPALLCSEPITLSQLTQNTLLVVRSWVTDKNLVHDAVRAIGDGNIIGVVMNDSFDSSRSYDYYGHYGIAKPPQKRGLLGFRRIFVFLGTRAGKRKENWFKRLIFRKKKLQK